MGELSEEHRRKMAQDAEGAGFGIHARFAGVPVDHFARNEVENLLENDHIGAGWCFFCSYHPTEWQGFQSNTSPLFTLNYEFQRDGCGVFSHRGGGDDATAGRAVAGHSCWPARRRNLQSVFSVFISGLFRTSYPDTPIHPTPNS